MAKQTIVWNASSTTGGNRKFGNIVYRDSKKYLKDDKSKKFYPILSGMSVETIRQYKKRVLKLEKEYKDHQLKQKSRREYLRSLRR